MSFQRRTANMENEPSDPLPTRRDVLQKAVMMGAGVLGAAVSGPFASPVGAIEPIVRGSGPKFKFSLAAYSYRKLLLGDPPELTLGDFISDCAKMGLDGTELTSYYFPPEPSDEYLNQLRHRAFTLGLDVSGTAVRNDFCYPAGEDRDKEIVHVKRWVDYAAKLGAPVIRIFSGQPRDGQSEMEAHRLAVDGIEECCDYAGRHGVFLALENHGGLTTTIDGIMALVEDVKSPWFGVNLDTGNFNSSDVYADLALLAPYSVNVQVKVVVRPNRGPKQPSDFKRIARILSDSGYRGYIVLEYEENEDARSACPRYIEALRAAFA